MPSRYGGETIIALSLSLFKRRHIRWDVAGSASSVPNTHDETAKRAGLRSSVVMRHLAIHGADRAFPPPHPTDWQTTRNSSTSLKIGAILLAIGLSQARTSGRDLSKESGSRVDSFVTEPPRLEVEPESEPEPEKEPKEDVKRKDSKEDDQLPILPPIILLDFGNDTDDDNATSEEKSKRTVNNGLGYGLDKNNLQPKRYNYYFPAGKSGTTVSIEESISPFMPKTIIENVQPAANQKGYYFGTQRNSFPSESAGLQAQSLSASNLQFLNAQQTKGQSTFGLRTKPQTPATSFGYQKLLSTPKPLAGSYGIQNSELGYRGNNVPTSTQSPLAFSPTETVRYVTPSPANFANPLSGTFHYARQGPFAVNAPGYAGQRQRTQSNINSHGFGSAGSVSQSVESSTVAPVNYNPRYQGSGQQTKLPNGPRYTVENGVRYENKVFWKYPDGRVSDVPPATYVETYSAYPDSNTGQHQPPTKSQGSHSIYEVSTTENSVYSQGPVQFPVVPEQNGQEPNLFVPPESLTGDSPRQQVFRLGYQNLVGRRQNANQPQPRKPGVQSNAAGHKVTYGSLYEPVTSRYMVNSPDPEYTDGYTTESTLNATTPISNLFASSADTSSPFGSRYTSKAQSYLDSVLSGADSPKKHGPPNNDPNNYSNLQYSDLLSYNPSISEYIRNPSSILNVRPTFVQAGNSLIPVIILRVDGVSPIRSKSTQNINLKALLQQYLVQYANSIQDLARPSTYDLGTESIGNGNGQSQVASKSPILDLIRLTQEDARDAPPPYDPMDYIGRSSYEASNLEFAKSLADSQYGERTQVRQKTKNVQIVDDPRFTSYKAKS
ncbi:uncharacterized protein LOC143363003 [Halictus rubicundus]|uniref:uncharacterized protein LOC143363003 n=1 Tax=Halictus rubicundus TaxID=77578 RepID=UPI00403664F7